LEVAHGDDKDPLIRVKQPECCLSQHDPRYGPSLELLVFGAPDFDDCMVIMEFLLAKGRVSARVPRNWATFTYRMVGIEHLRIGVGDRLSRLPRNQIVVVLPQS